MPDRERSWVAKAITRFEDVRVARVESDGLEMWTCSGYPADAVQLGILADYYRAVGDPEGSRTQVVDARCGLRKPKLVLSPKDIYIN